HFWTAIILVSRAVTAASRTFDVFFFQAEDGIRDRNVTGVQTCALPISSAAASAARRPKRQIAGIAATPCGRSSRNRNLAGSRSRSEERRVGKECRARWSPDH